MLRVLRPLPFFFGLSKPMFVSTGASTERVSFRETLRRPIPERGHLWVPEALPSVAWPPEGERPLWEFVSAALTPLVGEDCEEACKRALLSFPIALEKESDNILALQLHMGPTRSFKDVGCRVAAELHRTLAEDGRVVVATSGDTGSAAAHAFENVCVLYPQGRVSPYQEQQMLANQSAVALAVPGDFDDCQRMAKDMLSAGEALSCNSVSLARLLPQIGMYAWAAARVPNRVFFVPSGNYGNAVACLMAKKMGARIQSVHMACNENGRALVDLLRGSCAGYRPTSTIRTPATAMDVGRPSNAVRLLHYAEKGDVAASVVSSGTIRHMVDKRTCPHTACAMYAALQERIPGAVVVRTADAVKFSTPLIQNTQQRSPFVLRTPRGIRKRSPRAVLLVGMPGTGKTTLSFMLGGDCSDCVMVGEKGQKHLPEVIATFDTPDAFIAHEGQTVIRMLDSAREARVLATGGSALHSNALRSYLRGNDGVVVVWLRREAAAPSDWSADWSARGVVVPLGTSIESPEQVKRLRTPLYAAAADFELRTDVWDAQRCAVALGALVQFLRR